MFTSGAIAVGVNVYTNSGLTSPLANGNWGGAGTSSGASSTYVMTIVFGTGYLSSILLCSGPSDERLKKNITDYTYDLAKFKLLQPKEYNWIHPEYHLTKKDKQRGFVAQDVESIDEYWVSDYSVPKDSKEHELLTDGVGKSLTLGQKDAMYVSVIQQLLTKIETLEARITTLEGA